MKLRRRLVVVIVVLAVGIGAWLLVSGRLGGRRTPSRTLTLYGNIDVREVELGFRVAGRLQWMAFEEGQAVSAGAHLATLDARPFEDNLRAAEADEAAQEANVDKLVAGSRKAELAKGRAAVAEAAAAQRNARASLERAQRLFETNAIPRSQLDDALAAAKMSDARLASSQDEYRLLFEGPRKEDVRAGQAMLQAAEARVAAAQTALEDTRLVAPADGIIISRVREPGAIVSPNDVVYVLSLTSSVWVRAYVAEPDLGKLWPGMKAEVLSDAAPSRALRGHVGFISPTAEFTPKSVETPDLRTALVYRLRIIVDEPDPRLRQGMPVTVRIDTGASGP